MIHQSHTERRFWKLKIETVGPFLERIDGGGVVIPFRRSTGDRIVLVSVPWADQAAVFDLPLSEWSALVWTMVVERSIAPLSAGDADRPIRDHHGGCFAHFQIDIQSMPYPECHFGHGGPSLG